MAKFSIDLKTGGLKQDSEVVVGIDLGTTNSLVAYIQDGQPLAVKDPGGKSTLLPSVLHFSPDGTVTVGDAAKALLLSDPAHTIYSVKRLMGKSYHDVASVHQYFGYHIIDEDPDKLVKIRVYDRYFTPIELSAEILKALKLRIEANLGTTISKAVITVPAYFNDAQRQATRDAGRLAGLDVLRIVNEPTAASLAYGLGLDPAQKQTVAVYDLGGGTFDVSILQIQDGIFEVLATHGDTFLGGDDFDRAIIDHWLAQYPDLQQAQQDLRLLAEAAKKALSATEVFADKLGNHTLTLSRAQFEELIEPFIQRTLNACRAALQDAQRQAADIDQVIMVGGSTRTPRVKAAVADFFGRPVYDQVNPDEVVALGAAIQADILSGNQRNILLLDVTPLSLGIETVGGLMDVILPRNAKIPASVGRKYTTSVDGQRNLKIAVYQGERDLVANNRKLGEFILRGIPPMAAGMPKIQIQFLLNADGILRVKAIEERSGVEQAIEIKPQYGISEEEMARMLLDSIQHAQEDLQTRALLEARNEAQVVLVSVERFFQQHQDLLSPEEIATTQALADQLRASAAGENKDQINAALEALNTYTAPLAHRAMDAAVAAAMTGQNIADAPQ